MNAVFKAQVDFTTQRKVTPKAVRSPKSKFDWNNSKLITQ